MKILILLARMESRRYKPRNQFLLMKKLALIFTSSLLGLGQLQAADGKAIYNNCLACHQANGQGTPGLFPPLAESEWVNGPIDNVIKIVLRGMTGPVEVKGQPYNGLMTPFKHLSDEEVAAVITYIRSNFGNESSEVTAEQVKALRSEADKPMITVAELIDPNSDEAKAIVAKENGGTEEAPAAQNEDTVTDTPAPKPEEKSGKVTHSEKKAGPNYLVIGSIAAWAFICIIPVILGIGRRP